MTPEQSETMRRVHGFLQKEYLLGEALAVRDTIDDVHRLTAENERLTAEIERHRANRGHEDQLYSAREQSKLCEEVERLTAERDEAVEARRQGLAALEVYREAGQRWVETKTRLEAEQDILAGIIKTAERDTAERIAQSLDHHARNLVFDDIASETCRRTLLTCAVDIRGGAWGKGAE